ncbi:MAG: hypothetical protein FWB71_01240 [Defluviitaleaceae bacterium]|nr:hypothetical protein [Defluviitaleaceae bacterium]
MNIITLALILLAIGLALLAIEVFTAGLDFGISGVLGFAALAGSAVVVIYNHGFLGVIIVICALGFLIPSGIVFMRWVRRRQIYGKFILTETLAEAKSDISGLDFFMGKEGITKTALRPHGDAAFNGAKVEVWSESTYIPANARIKVIDIRDKKVIVRPAESN